MMLRQHLANYPPVEGLLALLGQRATAKAVIAMLRDPSYEWTLDELAARAVVSRATLIRSFGRTSGVAPLTFLTELRLGSEVHHAHLASNQESVERESWPKYQGISQPMNSRYRPGARHRCHPDLHQTTYDTSVRVHGLRRDNAVHQSMIKRERS